MFCFDFRSPVDLRYRGRLEIEVRFIRFVFASTNWKHSAFTDFLLAAELIDIFTTTGVSHYKPRKTASDKPTRLLLAVHKFRAPSWCRIVLVMPPDTPFREPIISEKLLIGREFQFSELLFFVWKIAL